MTSRRLEALLAGPALWHRVDHHEVVTSTSDLATAAAAEGVAPGLVVVADRQTAGRGRAGRAWRDHPGGSLLASALVPAPRRATLVPLAAGLAVHHAIRRLGPSPTLKWPNDVLLEGAKCAGILVENPGSGTLVVGIGIDIDWRGHPRDGEAGAWVSLADVTGADVDRWDVLTDTLAALGSWLLDVDRDPSVLLAAYRSRCATLGTEVAVAGPAGTVTGEAADIDDDGALVVRTTSGDVRVVAGDVTAAG